MQIFILNKTDFPIGFDDDTNSEIMFGAGMRGFFISASAPAAKKNPQQQQKQHSFYLKLLWAKSPLFISAFQGPPPPTVSHQNQR